MCIGDENCTCFVGFTNQYCNETSVIRQIFAGYSIVSRAGILVLNADLNITGNIATTSSLLSLYSPYGINVESGIVHEQDSFASNLVSQALYLFDPSKFVSNYDYLLNDAAIPVLEVKRGGTYKLSSGWRGPSKVIISTMERVVFGIYGDNLVSENVELVFTDCASPYNVYWSVDKSAIISGNFKGNVIAKTIVATNSIITGTLFSISTAVSPTFQNVSFVPKRNDNPYQTFSFQQECNYTYCYGIDSMDSNVCSGIGTCIGYNTCSCPNGKGYDCSVEMCNGVLSTDSSSCSGHGTCISNVCSCDSGYNGTDCSQTTCNGISSSSASSCNSNGLCKALDTCLCKIGFNGTFCNDVDTRKVVNPFAGYSIILSGASIFLKTLKHLYISGNIAVSGSKLEPTSYYHPQIWGEIIPTNYYHPQGGGVMHKNDWEANQVVSTALALAHELSALSCDFSYGLSNPNLYIHSGGVYCFPQGWTGPSKVLINGPERVVFKIGFLNYNNFDVTMINYASPSSVFWLASQFVISGEFKGTMMAPYGDLVSGVKVTGTIFLYSSQQSTLKTTIYSASFSPVPTFDPYEPIPEIYRYTLCYGVSSNSSLSCSGNGECIDYNKCSCKQGFSSDVCSTVTCGGIPSSNNSVCSSHGSCIGPNSCNCSFGYYGRICELTTCHSIPMNSTLVCSGNGTCVGFNNCSCFQGFNGSDCSIRNTTLFNGTTTNTNITTNSTNPTVISNSTIINTNCTSNLNCSGHGVCKNSKCSCFSTSVLGFWTGYFCSQCKPGYYGDQCLTLFEKQLRITSDFKGLELYLHSPPTKTEKEISCSKLLNEDEINDNFYGIEPKCQYVNKTSSLFMITFGSFDFTIYPGATIRLNALVFDSLPAFEWITFTVGYPLNMSNLAPVALIKIPPYDTFSSCDTIPVDGSLSFSVDRKPLRYYWSLLNTSSSIEVYSTITNQPTTSIRSDLAPGNYQIKLLVYSVYLNKFSAATYSKKITKAAKPLPSLSIYKDETTIERLTYQFPLTIKKTITTSSCQSEFDRVKVEWTKQSGPTIDFIEDSYNNLVIAGVKYFEESSYVFRVSAYYTSDPSLRVSTDINLFVRPPNITLNIMQLESKSDHTLLKVDYSDPETLINPEASSVWTWSCLDHSSSRLLSLLGSVSSSKTSLFNITTELFDIVPTSIHLRLKILKYTGTTKTKDTIVNFNNIPPLVNFINIEPKSSTLVAGQTLAIQILVSSSANSATFNSVVWTLNNVKLDKSRITEQTEDDKRTSTAYIDTSNLPEGSTNSVSLFTYDASKGTSTESSYVFQIASSPKPCECAISPTRGFALDTDFEFMCFSCKSEENSIDLRYGFIDDRSGLKVPLYNLGEVYSSKLPAPFSGSKVACFFEIVDTVTGAFTTVYKYVTVEKPEVADIEKVQDFVSMWSKLSISYSLEGEFSKSIYQSASTSRTDSVLVKDAFSNMTSSRHIDIICVNGYDIAGVCKCKDGYIGTNCDSSIRDFSNIQKRKLQILNGMIQIANNTDVTITDDYVGLLAFAIDSLLVNYPYLNSETILESLHTLNTFLNYALGESNLKVANGVETLMMNCIQQARNYIKDKEYVADQSTNSAQLLLALQKSTTLIARNNPVGCPQIHVTSSFYSIVSSRHTLYNFPYKITDNSTSTSVEIESFVDLNYVISYVSQKPFVYSLSVISDIFSLQSRLGITKQNEDSDMENSYLISPIVSLSFSDVPISFSGENGIYYNIPINKTSYQAFAVDNLDVTHISRSFVCGNFRDGSAEIRKDCSLISITDKTARCRCSQLTNVFIIETKTSSSVSYLLVAIFVSLVVGLLCIALCISITIYLCCFTIKKKRREIHDEHIILCENASNSSRENTNVPTEISPRKTVDKPVQKMSFELKSNLVHPVTEADLTDM